jgi:hypothetical protein
LVLKAGKTFLDSLFNGGGPEGIADVAELIRRAPVVATNGEFPQFAKYESFSESWTAAKTYVGRSLQGGEWRFNRNPMIDTTDPSKPRLVMRSRWHLKLRAEVLGGLYVLDKIVSTDPDEVLPEKEHYHEPFRRCLLRLNALIFHPDNEVSDIMAHALKHLRWIYFDDMLLGGEERETARETAVFTKAQREALNWIKAQMPDTGMKACVMKFAVGWASRYQCRISERATWKSVNTIFQTSRYSPIPDFDPTEAIKGEAEFDGCKSQDEFDSRRLARRD